MPSRGRRSPTLVAAAGTDENLIRSWWTARGPGAPRARSSSALDRRLRRLPRDAALLSRPRCRICLDAHGERRYTVTARHCSELAVATAAHGDERRCSGGTCTSLTDSSTPGVSAAAGVVVGRWHRLQPQEGQGDARREAGAAGRSGRRLHLRGADAELPCRRGNQRAPAGRCLAAILVGPWAGALCVAVVLMVQALCSPTAGSPRSGSTSSNMALITAVRRLRDLPVDPRRAAGHPRIASWPPPGSPRCSRWCSPSLGFIARVRDRRERRRVGRHRRRGHGRARTS